MQSRRFSWLLGLSFAGLLLAACEGDIDEVQGTSAPCGPVACGPAEYCCDATCGICASEEVACGEIGSCAE